MHKLGEGFRRLLDRRMTRATSIGDGLANRPGDQIIDLVGWKSTGKVL